MRRSTAAFLLAALGISIPLQAAINVPLNAELSRDQIINAGTQVGKGYESMTKPGLGDLTSAACARNDAGGFTCVFVYDPQVRDGQVNDAFDFTYLNVLTVKASYLDGILGEEISELVHSTRQKQK